MFYTHGKARASQATGSIWGQAWSSCLLKPHTPPPRGLASAFPRQETACSGDTCEHEKGEGRRQRGRNLFYLTAFHLYPSGAWVICYYVFMPNEQAPPYVKAKMPVG